MVDFNDSNTVARNKKEIGELTTLQRRYETANAVKEYRRYKYADRDEASKLPDVQAELTALYDEVFPIIEKDLNKKGEHEYKYKEEVLAAIENSNDEQGILKAWYYINSLLYKLHLTQIDSQKDIDWSDPEEVNEEHEL